MKVLQSTLVAVALVTCLSCGNHPPKVTQPTDSTPAVSQDPTVQDYIIPATSFGFDGEYIEVEAVGESVDRQMAVSDARAKAFEKATETIQNIANNILGTTAVVSKYEVFNYKTVDQKLYSYYNEKGVKIYESHLILKVPLKDLVEGAYASSGSQGDYGEYLKAMEQQLSEIQNKTTK